MLGRPLFFPSAAPALPGRTRRGCRRKTFVHDTYHTPWQRLVSKCFRPYSVSPDKHTMGGLTQFTPIDVLIDLLHFRKDDSFQNRKLCGKSEKGRTAHNGVYQNPSPASSNRKGITPTYTMPFSSVHIFVFPSTMTTLRKKSPEFLNEKVSCLCFSSVSMFNAD